MSVTGSGVGTPIAPGPPASGEAVYDIFEELTPYANAAVALHRYAQIIGYDECAFWGVIYEGQRVALCNTLWTQVERQRMAQALAEAQQDIEAVAGYPLAPVWVVGDLRDEPDGDDRWVDSQPYRVRQVARYAHVIEAGARTIEVVDEDAAIDHTDDPARVVVPFTGQAGEVRVVYPGSNRRIYPSRVTVHEGEAQIEIPRCRLIRPDLQSNPRGGWMYEDPSNFMGVVEVRREYADPSRQAILVRHGCKNRGCANGCEECTADACALVIDPQIGVMDVRPALYADGTWSPRTLCGRYGRVRLYYRAGLQRISPTLESAIVRLAHARAPEAPCGCPHTEHVWRRDRHVPDVLTRERLECPFGLSDGAWQAYRLALGLRVLRGGVI